MTPGGPLGGDPSSDGPLGLSCGGDGACPGTRRGGDRRGCPLSAYGELVARLRRGVVLLRLRGEYWTE